MEDVMEELYVMLYPKALAVVLHRINQRNYYECALIAHDITVDFLYFSKSYKETYDRSRSIKPFFNSYTVKKLFKYYERGSKELNRFCEIKPDSLVGYDAGVNYIDFMLYVQGAVKYLEGKYFATRKFAVPLASVFWAVSKSVAENGEIRVGQVAEFLGCRPSLVWGCIAKMRRTLERGGYFVTQDLGKRIPRGFGKRMQKDFQGVYYRKRMDDINRT